MKKIVSFALLALTGMAVTLACVKKSEGQPAAAVQNAELTVIVMDTTQALLPDVEVQCGKAVLKTSFDGRVVLKLEHLEGVKKLEISAQGYVSQNVSLADVASPLLVSLIPKEKKSEKHYMDYESVRASGRPTMRADKDAAVVEVLAVAEEESDYAFLELPESGEAAVVTGYGMHSKTKAASVMPNNISAGKLTAGEVNDFSKWYFWPTVIDSTHKAFVGEWQLFPKERYTVQVMNKAGYPVVNYPVNLTDKQGNTVFQAMTDNTGKAELWNGLITAKGKGVEVQVPEKVTVIDEPCEAPEGVDVMFVFDATGSMGDELRYMQAEMKDVIARAKDATGGLAIRTGAVVYRDHGDEYITRISRLTEDIKATQSFIDKQKASGGGDFPEAVPEALMAALNSAGWNTDARARIAFLILDAPCHQDSITIALLHDQILNAAAQGIRIVPVVCSGLDKSGEYLMRAIALATNGTSFFLTDDSGIGHTHLKPTTDSLKVEHLNDMLVRTIVEFSAMPSCEPDDTGDVEINEQFIPNPFDAKDIEADPSIPHGEGVHYLVDVSGKLLGIFEGEVKTDQLPIGVYFIKSFYDGEWHTRKILIK